MAGDDRGDSIEVERAHRGVEIRVEREQDRQLGRPRRLVDQLARTAIELAGEHGLEPRELRGNVVAGEIRADLRVAARDIDRRPLRDRGAARE
ncbi:MAG: hypothetical protein QM831_42660 [Kofleriaceae bacterium]